MKRLPSPIVKTKLVVLLLLLASAAFGEWHSLGPVSNIESRPHSVVISAGTASVEIIAVTDSIMRVRVARDGQFGPDHSWAIVDHANDPKASFRVSESAKEATLSTATVKLVIGKDPFRISFQDAQGNILNSDSTPMAFDGPQFRVWKQMPVDEHYYGLGDKTTGIDHREHAYTNWNTDAYAYQEGTDPLYKDIPFFIAMNHGVAYGLFLDNTWRSSFDFGKEFRDQYSFGAEGGELNYYFIYGPDPKRVLEQFIDLTGHTALPPLWSLGFQQSRYSYMNEQRVLEVAKKFRDLKIPADVLYLDIDYQEKNRPFTISRERFPHFEQMVKQLGDEGFKVITITDLHIAKADYPPYNEGMKQDAFVHNPDGSVYVGKVWPGDSVFADFTNEKARQFWGSLYAEFVKDGVAGFWNDMNEPSVFNGPGKTMPLDLVHHPDWGGVATEREIHNVFGMLNTEGTWEGLTKLRPNIRPVVLTRAAYAGGGRFATTWTGDNSSTWNHMRISIPMLLNLGVSGFPMVGDDIGGFRGTPTPELLTRWIELGAFNPIFRDHTEKGSADQEPWVHGPEQTAIRKKYIDLRYRMLPYIYAAADDMSRTGIPMMRPLYLEYPQEEAFATNSSEFLWGPDILVAPKVENFIAPYEVQLPPGDWYDFWTGKKVAGWRPPEQQGGVATLKVDPPLGVLPVYVRAGALIPEQPVVQSTSETPRGPLELLVYPGPDCHGVLYADDGNTLNYRRGEYLRQTMTCEVIAGNVTVKLSAPEGSFVPWWKELKVSVAGGAAVTVPYQHAAQTISVK